VIRQLAEHRELSQIAVEKPGFRLELRRHKARVASEPTPL
jgi:hypothetical protein